MKTNQKCCQCLASFSMIKLPRKIPNCPHNLCEPCLREIIDTKQDIMICGLCSHFLQKQQFKIFPLNTSLLLSLPELSAIRLNNIEDSLLLIDPPVGFTRGEQPTQDELCPTHKVVMDIICVQDRQRICPHCALFGIHKHHHFKRVEDFHKEIDQKNNIFLEVQKQKEAFFGSKCPKIYQQINNLVEEKKNILRFQIEVQWKKYEKKLQDSKQKSLKKIENMAHQIEQLFISKERVQIFQKGKQMFQQWYHSCGEAVNFIGKSLKVDQKIDKYFQSPLLNVQTGWNYLEQLQKLLKSSIEQLNNQLSLINFQQSSEDIDFDQYFSINKGKISLTNEDIHTILQVNPFLNCSSSQINIRLSQMMNNTSIVADISNITKNIQTKATTCVSPKKAYISMKSIEKYKCRDLKNKISIPNSPKANYQFKRPSSQIVNNKLSSRTSKNKAAQQFISVNQERPIDLKQSQRIYQQFTKNTLSDFFDISQCNLPNETVVEYVHRARRTHRIKGLKLCNNKLTSSGFEKLCQRLQGVSNINLANNLINQTIFEIIIRNKQKLESLRVLNLSHNPITMDKKSQAKMEEVKKYGVIFIV